jgi:hypothetical protein
MSAAELVSSPHVSSRVHFTSAKAFRRVFAILKCAAFSHSPSGQDPSALALARV